MTHAWLALGLVLAASRPAPAPAAEPARLTPEILESLVVVSDVALSPDGRQVLYRASAPAEAEGRDRAETRHELWVRPAGEGVARRFVTAESNPTQPAWSPDGQWISFLSPRRLAGAGDESDGGERTRLHVMRADGGEARALTPDTMSIAAYRWAPDSASIAVIARPDDAEDVTAAKKRGEDWTRVDHDLTPRTLLRVDLSTGDQRELVGPNLAVWAMDWSPDGRQLVVAVTDRARTDDQFMRQRLVVVPVGGGPPRALVGERGKLESPRWSPDGTSIAWLGGLDRHDPAAGTVHVVPAAGGEPRAIAADAAVNLRALEWLAPDRLAVAGEEGVRSVLAVLGLDGTERRIVQEGLAFSSFSASRDGRRFAVAASTRDRPAEAYLVGEGLETPQRLTIHNEVLATLQLGTQQRIEWTARDGTRIEGVLIVPADLPAGRRAPLLVTPHGGPESASLDGWNAGPVALGQLAAARGWIVLLPNYRGSTGRGEAFSRADHRDLGGAEFDDVLDGIQALVDRGLADPKAVGIAGGSYGGYFAAWGATRHSPRFAAAVTWAGIANWLSFVGTTDIPDENTWVHWGHEEHLERPELLWERSPLAHVASARTPTLILHGERDERVPPSQGRELHAALTHRGVPTELVLYPRAPHSVRERAHRLDVARRSLDWLARFLGSARP